MPADTAAAKMNASGISECPKLAGRVKPTNAPHRPPITKAPSTPTLNAPERKQMAVATPVNRSGVAADNVAAILLSEPKDSAAMSEKTSSGFSPITSRMAKATMSATIKGNANPTLRSNSARKGDSRSRLASSMFVLHQHHTADVRNTGFARCALSDDPSTRHDVNPV